MGSQTNSVTRERCWEMDVASVMASPREVAVGLLGWDGSGAVGVGPLLQRRALDGLDRDGVAANNNGIGLCGMYQCVCGGGRNAVVECMGNIFCLGVGWGEES